MLLLDISFKKLYQQTLYTFRQCLLIKKDFDSKKNLLNEDLIREKQNYKSLQNETNKLKARLQFYEKDLVIQGEVDYKRELKQALIRLKNKEEEVFELMQNTNYKTIIEMKRTISSLKQELEKYHVYQNFSGSTKSIINDNIELFQKLQQSIKSIKELEKIKVEYFSIARKHQQLQLVLQAKDQQLQKFRGRDHLTCSKNESQLREELLIKDEEISHLKTQLAIARKTNIEDKAIIDQTQQELKQKINHHEIDHLQKESQQLAEKARNFDRYLIVNQKRKMTWVEDQQSNSQYTQENQVEDIVFELKLSLRKNNISDIQDKEFEYNPEQKSPVPHVRSVFRTLLQHYQLNFDDYILQTVAKACFQVFEFCSRKNIHKLNQQELLESVSQLDLQWNSKCFDCFQQLYYNKYKGFLQFEVQNVKKLFEQFQIQ
ncbi:unnamed protein product [Paramecium pentaurelia]|uniref:Uncharacterized protein n=1 Tax=Paramecium pentaurelia TaxID=43138 RepID=A0A8S1TQ28_9CILI|nr:unnamed protein product [Paramecium pentaurelia]